MTRLVIDASRALSGGGVIHLKNFVQYLDTDSMVFKPLLVCHPKHRSFINLEKFECIFLRNKATSVLFQMIVLPFMCIFLRARLVNIDASSFNFYRADITISRDAQAFDPSVIRMYDYTSLKYIRLLLIRWLQIYQLRRSKETVFLTKYHKILVSQYTGDIEGKGVVIPHGIDMSIIGTHQRIRRSPSEAVNCVYVSNFAPYKRHDVVLSAILIVAELGYKINLSLIGEPEPHEIAQLVKSYARALPNGSRVDILGAKDYATVLEHLSGNHFAIFASECETFSNILREKVATGIPVLCADVHPLFEVAGEFATYYRHNEPRDLAEKIMNFVNNFESVQQAEDRYRHEFFQDLDWPSCIGKYQGLLREICPKIYE